MAFKLGQVKPRPRVALWYTQYIQSPEWAARRVRVLKRAKGKCEHPYCKVTDTTGSLTIHHITYISVTEELLGHLLALCDAHHRERHTSKLIPYMWRIYDPNWKPHVGQYNEPEVK